MTELSPNQVSLVFIGTIDLVLVGLFAWILTRQANALLKDVQEECSQGLWEELGAPTTMREAVGDPKQRWIKFIRSGRYRTVCSPTLALMIDSFRTSTTWGLFIFALLGCGILYLFWPLLKPKFF